VLGHEPTDMADGPRTWLMRILSDAWVPRVLVANSTDVGGVRSAGQCEARQRRRDSGGVRSSAKFTLPPQTLSVTENIVGTKAGLRNSLRHL
jgi:hypothetical protein